MNISAFLSTAHMASRPRWWQLSLVAFAALLLWDGSGGDMALASVFGGYEGFPLRGAYLLETVLHHGARNVGWGLVALTIVLVRWPLGHFRRLDFLSRLQVPASILIALAAVTVMKAFSRTSCPWDLAAFGGTLPYVSHWSWGVADGGGGGCFPAGHASTGFAFLGAWFALRPRLPAVARMWLAAALVAGLGLGVAQQLRGAHFASHTLWTAWICWTTGGLVDGFFRHIVSFKPSAATLRAGRQGAAAADAVPIDANRVRGA